MYKVLNTFKEKEHDNTIYEADGFYPAEGYEADEKRVSFLQEVHPEYGIRFLSAAVTKEDAPVTEKPKTATKKKKSDPK